MNNIVTFKKPAVSEIAPTTNQLIHYVSYLNHLIRNLEFHATRMAPAYSPDDIDCIRDAVVRASYTMMIFNELLAQDPNAISSDYDNAIEMNQVIDLTRDMVDASVTTPASIATIVEINRILRSVIENYYFRQVKRPWWMFWR